MVKMWNMCSWLTSKKLLIAKCTGCTCSQINNNNCTYIFRVSIKNPPKNQTMSMKINNRREKKKHNLRIKRDVIVTCVVLSCHAAWSICHILRTSRWSLGIYACVHGSSDCKVWWSAADSTCRWTRISDASCDESPIGSHHCRFSWRQTLWQLITTTYVH